MASLLAVLLLSLACSVMGSNYTVKAINSNGAFVHLFEWSWKDIAKECEDFLGPKGFDAVQVSPPQEHITGDAWWTRYQPVTYSLVSRSGNLAQFKDKPNLSHENKFEPRATRKNTKFSV